jgi:hypothetical protein
VIKKPREQGGHSLRWAAEPEKINNKFITAGIADMQLMSFSKSQ